MVSTSAVDLDTEPATTVGSKAWYVERDEKRKACDDRVTDGDRRFAILQAESRSRAGLWCSFQQGGCVIAPKSPLLRVYLGNTNTCICGNISCIIDGCLLY